MKILWLLFISFLISNQSIADIPVVIASSGDNKTILAEKKGDFWSISGVKSRQDFRLRFRNTIRKTYSGPRFSFLPDFYYSRLSEPALKYNNRFLSFAGNHNRDLPVYLTNRCLLI